MKVTISEGMKKQVCSACGKRRLIFTYLIERPRTTSTGWRPSNQRRCRACSSGYSWHGNGYMVYGWARWDEARRQGWTGDIRA